jgi:hypothetical protein
MSGTLFELFLSSATFNSVQLNCCPASHRGAPQDSKLAHCNATGRWHCSAELYAYTSFSETIHHNITLLKRPLAPFYVARTS